MKFGNFIFLLNVSICKAFHSEYCNHGQIVKAIQTSVECKKTEIENKLQKHPLTSNCRVVTESEHLQQCVSNGFGKCLSDKNLLRLKTRTQDIIMKGIKENCPKTETDNENIADPIFDWLGNGVETDETCSKKKINTLNKEIEKCIDDNLYEITDEINDITDKNELMPKLCAQFEILLNYCADFKHIACLTERETGFLKQQIEQKGKWIFLIMNKYMLLNDLNLFTDCRAFKTSSNIATSSNLATSSNMATNTVQDSSLIYMFLLLIPLM